MSIVSIITLAPLIYDNIAVLTQTKPVGALSEVAALTWPQLALACGRAGEALMAAEAGTAAHSKAADIWSQAIVIATQKALQQVAIHMSLAPCQHSSKRKLSEAKQKFSEPRPRLHKTC